MAPLPGSLRKSQHTKYPSQSLSLALHYLPFASRFPLPHFTLAVLSAHSIRLSLFVFLEFAATMSESGEVIANEGNNNNMETLMPSMILLRDLLSCILKSFESVVVILLGKELFKISLLVPVLCPSWVALFFTELVALRMQYLCS